MMSNVMKVAVPVVASIFGGPALGSALGMGATAGSAIASGLASAMMGGMGKQAQPQQAAAPTATAPTTVPLPDDAAVQAAKAKQIAAQQQSSGRVSTILSQPGGSGSDKLG